MAEEGVRGGLRTDTLEDDKGVNSPTRQSVGQFIFSRTHPPRNYIENALRYIDDRRRNYHQKCGRNKKSGAASCRRNR